MQKQMWIETKNENIQRGWKGTSLYGGIETMEYKTEPVGNISLQDNVSKKDRWDSGKPRRQQIPPCHIQIPCNSNPAHI